MLLFCTSYYLYRNVVQVIIYFCIILVSDDIVSKVAAFKQQTLYILKLYG